MIRKRLKAVISSLLLLAFLYLAATGAMLYFGKTGLILGIPRRTLLDTHAWVALFMAVLVVVHLILNLQLYVAGLKSLAKRDRGNHSSRDDCG